MTSEMYEVLRGALLGDGCLNMNKKGVNARFMYSSKSYQHVEYVTKWFSKYSQHGIKYSTRYDKRTDKYYEKYSFFTRVSQTLTEEYHKWYYDGVKHIPNDLILTPLMCKIWYLGDGYLVMNSNAGTSQKLGLCTNCFSKEELENILLPQLSKFKPHLVKQGNEQYIISIGHKKYIKKFLEYIGECPFDDYSYKWNVIESRKGYNGESPFCDDINEWIFLYQSGLSFVKIGALYGCTRGAVEPHLYKEGIVRHVGDPIPDDYKQWNTLYSNTKDIEKIEEVYKRNAIKRYIDYVCKHDKWPSGSTKIDEIIV